jgi:hypothetical protein
MMANWDKLDSKKGITITAHEYCTALTLAIISEGKSDVLFD